MAKSKANRILIGGGLILSFAWLAAMFAVFDPLGPRHVTVTTSLGEEVAVPTNGGEAEYRRIMADRHEAAKPGAFNDALVDYDVWAASVAARRQAAATAHARNGFLAYGFAVPLAIAIFVGFRVYRRSARASETK